MPPISIAMWRGCCALCRRIPLTSSTAPAISVIAPMMGNRITGCAPADIPPLPRSRGCLQISGVCGALMIFEPAPGVDGHDRADGEQDHRALAAVAVRLVAAAIDPHARGDDQHRDGKLDQRLGGVEA